MPKFCTNAPTEADAPLRVRSLCRAGPAAANPQPRSEDDYELLAWQAANDKARELGWIV